ncbi:MAG: LytR/AlgR family response regulator transcription factor [Lentimicrobium sp.]
MKPTTLTAVIIDDEPEAINGMLALANGIEHLEITGTTTHPEKAVSLCLKTRPDIIFLDINMPGKDGFAVVQELHEHQFHPYTIFTTAWDQFTLQAIKAGALDYLLKPIDRKELVDAVQKAMDNKASHSIEQRIESLEKAVKNHRKLRFNTRSGFIMIHPDEIFYIEADANYSEIFYNKTKREVVSMNLGAVEALLPEQFIRISRSVIINSAWLTKLSGVQKKCWLRKESEEKEFCVPEKQMAFLKQITA